MPGEVRATFYENIGMDEVPGELSGSRRKQYTTNKEATNDTQFDPNYRIPAIKIRNACKKFGNHEILKNLNLTVPEFSIYTLIGASGCGKTTLLNCAIGLKYLDFGDIKIFGKTPGTPRSNVPGSLIGYMPQDICLFGEFTISEAMFFFGRIYGMKKQKIIEKIEFMLNLLDLPTEDRMIRTLSGGQKRRASLAVTLIHSPRVLIADEVTVGLDPLIRLKIWTHLKSLIHNKKATIIITTHHIDETSYADIVGLMRNGKLLTEESPTSLLQRYNTNNMEEIVLKLCLKDQNREIIEEFRVGEQGQGDEESCNSNSNSEDLEKSDNFLELKSDIDFIDSFTPFCNRLKALIIRNLVRIMRNFGFIAFLSMFPALAIIFFCYAIGGEIKGLEFGVINLESAFKQFPCNLSNSAYNHQNSNSKNVSKFGCGETYLSCVFLHTLTANDVLNLIEYKTVEEAVREMQNGNIHGYTQIDANFTEKIFLGNDHFDFDLENITEDKLSNSLIFFQLDYSNHQIALAIQTEIADALKRFENELKESCQIETGEKSQKFVEFGKSPHGEKPNFTEFIVPGVLIVMILFMSVSLSGLTLIIEKQQGMLERTMAAGVTYFDIILSHFITQYIIMLFQVFFALLIIIVWFKMKIHGSLFGVVLITILQGTIGILLGFVISVICSEESTVLQLSLGLVLPNFVLAGIIWPLEGMPLWMKYISYFIPETFAGISIRSIITNGWGLSHARVLPGILISFGWVTFLIIFLIVINTNWRKK